MAGRGPPPGPRHGFAQRGTIRVKLSPQGNPSMPDNQPESNRPPPDRRTPSLGGNMIWYLLALGMGTLFLVSLMDTSSQVELRYIDLDKLIEKGPGASIEVTEGVAGQGTRRPLLEIGQPEVWGAEDHGLLGAAGGCAKRRAGQGRRKSPLPNALRGSGEQQQGALQPGKEEGVHQPRRRKRAQRLEKPDADVRVHAPAWWPSSSS